MTAPVPTLPSASVVPLIADVVAQAVAERRQNASKISGRMENAARIAGISFEPHLVVSEFLEMTKQVVSAARLSEVVVAPRPSALSEREIAEALLFGTGRPVLLVPPAYAPQQDFSRIVVA